MHGKEDRNTAEKIYNRKRKNCRVRDQDKCQGMVIVALVTDRKTLTM